MGFNVREYLDPGKARCAIAGFWPAEKTLKYLAWQSGDTYFGVAGRTYTSARELAVTELLWEKPQIYPKSKSRPNDILDLCAAGARTVGHIEAATGVTARSVSPRAWKGQTVKPVHHLQLWAILEQSERDLVLEVDPEAFERMTAAARGYAMTKEVTNYSASVHNLLDAIALGCYDLGRLSGPIAGRVSRPSIKGARKAWRTR